MNEFLAKDHVESMGDKWFPLLASPSMIPGVIATTLRHGGTRPLWGTEEKEIQTMLMAWPERSLLRAGVVVSGPKTGRLEPVAVVPLMEGFANALEVMEVYPWKGGHVGEVQARPGEDGKPLWFHDPLFFRDNRVDLTPGVTQTFYLSGICFGLRRALLDEMTVTSGPAYEAWAAKWMESNPGSSRLDVPPLKMSLQGSSIFGPAGPRCCEYQARASIFDVDSFMFGPEGAQEKVWRFGVTVGEEKHPLHLILYAAERVCLQGYEPKEGHEVDVVFWMQGRVVDAGDEVEDGTEQA